jgi:prepilin-type processing-associated H-X9-DG protein
MIPRLSVDALLSTLMEDELLISRRNHYSGSWIEWLRVTPHQGGAIVSYIDGHTGLSIELARVTAVENNEQPRLANISEAS